MTLTFQLFFIIIDEVSLVEQNFVGESKLFNSLIFNALRLLVVKARDYVLGVDYRYDAVERIFPNGARRITVSQRDDV